MSRAEKTYQLPTTEMSGAAGAVALDSLEGVAHASRGSRVAANFVDMMLMVLVMVPIQWKLGVYDDLIAWSQNQNIWDHALWGLLNFAMLLAINGYLLATRAQSVGKLVLGIKIVTLSGENAGLSRIVLRRMAPVSLVSMFPVVGGLFGIANCLYIFRKDRRCIHDHIAGTRVVRF